MSLTPEQRSLCVALGLSERLVEDAATVSTSPCSTCRQEPCVCTLSEFPFGMGEETELDAKAKLKLAADAREQVAKDVRAAWNTKSDDVTFYPATETPLKS